MPSIPPLPPSGGPQIPPQKGSSPEAIALAKKLIGLIDHIAEEIRQKAPHDTLERSLADLEGQLEALKKLTPNPSFLVSTDEKVLELGAEVLKKAANFQPSEEKMLHLCTSMQAVLSSLIDQIS